MSEYKYDDIVIRQNTGNFILNKPNLKTTKVRVKIPAHEFNESISYDARSISIAGMPWHLALDEIAVSDPRTMRGRKHVQEIEEIIQEHYDEIEEAWEAHRVKRIKQQQNALQDELEELEEN